MLALWQLSLLYEKRSSSGSSFMVALPGRRRRSHARQPPPATPALRIPDRSRRHRRGLPAPRLDPRGHKPPRHLPDTNSLSHPREQFARPAGRRQRRLLGFAMDRFRQHATDRIPRPSPHQRQILFLEGSGQRRNRQ